MKTTKLTRAKLDQLIKEELARVNEMYGFGLASTKPAFKPTPKVYEEFIDETESPTIQVESLEEVPFAGDPSIPQNARISVPYSIEPTSEEKFNQELTKQIRTFQRWWRSLNIDIRYEVENWLKKALIKRLSHEEVSQLVASTTASTKAYTEPKKINQKPK